MESGRQRHDVFVQSWRFELKKLVKWRYVSLGEVKSMVVSGSPKWWDRWRSPSPNWQYILPYGGLYATYHLLGEPETTID